MADMPPTGLNPHMQFEDIFEDIAPPVVEPLGVEVVHLFADLVDAIAEVQDVEPRLVAGNERIH